MTSNYSIYSELIKTFLGRKSNGIASLYRMKISSLHIRAHLLRSILRITKDGIVDGSDSQYSRRIQGSDSKGGCVRQRENSEKVFTLQKRFTFEAAHFLPNHDGKCRRLHGHSWVGWIEVAGDHLQASGPQRGMLVDYGDISSVLRKIVDPYLDHHCLNETLNIPDPTSEAVAMWIYQSLAESDLPVTAVTIEETCTSSCTYRPHGTSDVI